MDYQETIEWLFDKLPMYQNVGSSAFKKDLTNIQAMCSYLDNPQNKFKSIHIAGTNGKGSTSHMLASIFQEAGYKIGLTTSPHLKDFRERIRVNGKLCTEKFVIDFVEKHQSKIQAQNASFFEIAIAMSFEYFAQEKVDLAIIETGLGGRLDSTNIINPELSIITNIGLEHTQFLGNTLAEIATEKAGIIKRQTPVVIGESTPETKAVFTQIANEKESKITFAEENAFAFYKSDLKGFYQSKNIRTVLTAIEELRLQNYSISDKNISDGLSKVAQNTGLRGRWEVLNEKPLTVADTAHNPHGLKEISKQIKATPHDRLHLVLGFVNDKDVLESLSYFPKDAEYYFSEPNVPRKFTIEELEKIIPKDLKANYFLTVKEALKAAKENSSENDFIYVGGSTFVVAEVM